MTNNVWYVNSTMIIRLSSLVDQDGDPVEDATVEMTECVDCDGDTPEGLSLPVTLTHDADGTYEATLDEEIEIDAGDTLYAKIVATSGATVREFNTIIRCRESKG